MHIHVLRREMKNAELESTDFNVAYLLAIKAQSLSIWKQIKWLIAQVDEFEGDENEHE